MFGWKGPHVEAIEEQFNRNQCVGNKPSGVVRLAFIVDSGMSFGIE